MVMVIVMYVPFFFGYMHFYTGVIFSVLLMSDNVVNVDDVNVVDCVVDVDVDDENDVIVFVYFCETDDQ